MAVEFLREGLRFVDRAVVEVLRELVTFRVHSTNNFSKREEDGKKKKRKETRESPRDPPAFCFAKPRRELEREREKERKREREEQRREEECRGDRRPINSIENNSRCTTLTKDEDVERLLLSRQAKNKGAKREKYR